NSKEFGFSTMKPQLIFKKDKLIFKNNKLTSYANLLLKLTEKNSEKEKKIFEKFNRKNENDLSL
ncbi:MAG: hypothetical protein ACWIPJ_05615, partial [Polaribacter sp.]